MTEFTNHQKNLIFRFYLCLNALNSSGRRFSPNHEGIRHAFLRLISDPKLVDYEKQLQSEQEKQEWNQMLKTFECLVDYSKRGRLSRLFGQRFSPLALGLTHVECAFALKEIIEHERWNYTTDDDANVKRTITEDITHLAKTPTDTTGGKSLLISEDDLNIGDRILDTYNELSSSVLASGIPATPDFAQFKLKIVGTLARCGYVARLAEEKVIGHRKLAITPEYKEFLQSIGINEDKVKALADELDRHSASAGIGESVRAYTLAPYELMKVVLDALTRSVMEQDGGTFEIPCLPDAAQPSVNDEMYYRTIAYGYVYRIAQQLCDEEEN